MLLPRPFWYLRHGQTDWNRVNRTQGRTDIPLNDTGIEQASQAADLLRDRGITALFCSPLGRARQTADIVAARLALPVQIRAGLREASFGTHEGEVMGAWFAAWVEGEVIPEGGESFAQLHDRALAAMNDILAESELPLIVGHGGFFRAVRAAMGFAASVRTPNATPLFCHAIDGAWQMEAATLP